MFEIPQGLEALRTLPVREVLNEEDIALNFLFSKAVKMVKQNSAWLYEKLDDKDQKEALQKFAQSAEKYLKEGRFGWNEQKILALRGQGKETFKDLVKNVLREFSTTILDTGSSVHDFQKLTLNNLQDLVSMIRPGVAVTQDIALIIQESMQEENISPFALGFMVNTALDLNSAAYPRHQLILRTDRGMWARISQAYLRNAHSNDMARFYLGMQISSKSDADAKLQRFASM